MDIKNAEYFFTNYVGYTPDDELKVKQTNDMIAHYVDASMESYLPRIYEACARDEVLNTKNIPKHLWTRGNLIEDAFYMCPLLTLYNSAPVYDPMTETMKTSKYYRENIEYFSVDSVLYTARKLLRQNEVFSTDKDDTGAVYHILQRYKRLKEKDIQPLDMLMFLILHHKDEPIRIIDLTQDEDKVLDELERYQVKLREKNLFRVVWRGSLDE